LSGGRSGIRRRHAAILAGQGAGGEGRGN
jgi:hypothetical protein